MSRSKKLLSGAGLRKLAREKLEVDQAKDIPKTDENKTPLAAFLDRHKTGFDPLRYAQEDQDFKEWSGELDPNKVLLVFPLEDPEEGTEISRLCTTLGFDVGESYVIKTPPKPNPGTYFGGGHLDRMLQKAQTFGCGVMVFDFELTPSQIRNLEKKLKIPVLDREAVILGIFKLHARTKLAQLQVELAELKFYSTRLTGLWMGLSRQRGGRGGLKGRGVGETQLELDRRTVKQRIQQIGERLKKEERIFHTQSKNRSRLPRVALVGYTNAGKSTLMHRLTGAPVLQEDKLFSTLDTTVRMMKPPTQPRILISDTVGFIRHLPHDLVASFKSTLLEAIESDLILVVVDVSHSEWMAHVETTLGVLDEIGAAEVCKVLVLNKCDRVPPRGSLAFRQIQNKVERLDGFSDQVWVSAIQERGVEDLKQKLMSHLKVDLVPWLKTEDLEEEGDQ